MEVLVTGGAGFIGGWVAEELAARGHNPHVFDRRTAPADTPGGYRVLGDVRDPTAVMEAMAHADGWIHLAAVLGTQETVRDPRPAMETNVGGALNVFEAAAHYQTPGVYICVGNWFAHNPYSISKTCAEQLATMYNRERGCRINLVRCVNAYGPRQAAPPPFGAAKVRKIVPAMACRALSGMPVEVYGHGEQVSDMVWVGDAARTLVAALEHAAGGNVADRVVECGPADHWTVNQIAQLISTIVNPTVDPWITHLPMRPGERPGQSVTADPETLRLVGIDPASLRPLADGLAETVDWFAANQGVTWHRPRS